MYVTVALALPSTDTIDAPALRQHRNGLSRIGIIHEGSVESHQSTLAVLNGVESRKENSPKRVHALLNVGCVLIWTHCKQ